jgi:NTE family protein
VNGATAIQIPAAWPAADMTPIRSPQLIGDSDLPARRPARTVPRGRGWVWRRRPSRLNLALQGGGAHGAFTWGVLVRLLEAEIRIEGISGASAGALNAVVLASGWLSGGAAGAARALDELWREIARLGQMSRLRAGGLTQLAADFAAQFLSPYQLNPMGVNPLRPVLERLVEFERLRAVDLPRLFIAATDVATGRARIFRNAELSLDAVLASACLPQLHHAIEIDGAAYWDGGFSANPPLVPLVEACAARDVLLVQINPLCAERIPRTPREICNRIAEIAFGRPLAEELERLRHGAGAAFAPLNWLTRRRRRLVRHRVHTIDGSAELARLDSGTKADPAWPLLLDLRERGWRAADAWLRDEGGQRSTDPVATATIMEAPRRAG